MKFSIYGSSGFVGSRFCEMFSNCIKIPTENSNPSWFAFPVTVKDTAKFNRTQFTMFLENYKIQTRNYFGGNILLQPAYKHLITENPLTHYPNATKATTNTFFLGTSPVITDQHLAYIQGIVDIFLINM